MNCGSILKIVLTLLILLAILVFPYASAEEFSLINRYVEGQDGVVGLEAGNNRLAVSPDGKQLYSVGGHFAFRDQPDRGSLVVFNRDDSSGQLNFLQVFEHGVEIDQMVSPGGVTFSPDSRFIYVAANSTSFFGGRYFVFERDDDTGLLSEAWSYEGGFLNRSLAISPSGNTVYLGGGHGIISLDRTADGSLTPIAESEKPSYEADDITVSPDGRYLYVVGSRCARPSGTCTNVYGIGIMSRDTATGTLVAQENVERAELGQIRRVVMSPDGQYIYTSGSVVASFQRNKQDGSLTFLNLLRNVGGGNTNKIRVSADGARLLAGDALIDSSNPAGLEVIDSSFNVITERPTGLAADPDFNHIYSTGYNIDTAMYPLSLLHRINGSSSGNPNSSLSPVRVTINSNGSPTSAVIRGGVSRDNCSSFDTNYSVGEDIKIVANIVPEKEDIGKSVKVFVVVTKNNTFFQLTTSGLESYNGRLEDLIALSEITMKSSNDLDILSPFGGKVTLTNAEIGNFLIFVGYSSANGKVTYNEEAIALNVF